MRTSIPQLLPSANRLPSRVGRPPAQSRLRLREVPGPVSHPGKSLGGRGRGVLPDHSAQYRSCPLPQPLPVTYALFVGRRGSRRCPVLGGAQSGARRASGAGGGGAAFSSQEAAVGTKSSRGPSRWRGDTFCIMTLPTAHGKCPAGGQPQSQSLGGAPDPTALVWNKGLSADPPTCRPPPSRPPGVLRVRCPAGCEVAVSTHTPRGAQRLVSVAEAQSPPVTLRERRVHRLRARARGQGPRRGQRAASRVPLAVFPNFSRAPVSSC